jgi:hypothetical protein
MIAAGTDMLFLISGLAAVGIVHEYELTTVYEQGGV